MSKKLWTAEEESLLRELLLAGKTNKEISETLKRSYDSIDNKIKRMNVEGRTIAAKPRVVPEPSTEEDPNKELKEKILKVTRNKGQMSLMDVLRQVDASYKDIAQAIYELEGTGYEISLEEKQGLISREMITPPGGYHTSHFDRLSRAGTIKIGLISDNQLGNKSARLDVLETAYDHFEAEKITSVYHAGNLIDGYNPRINAFELLPEAGPSIERQCEYAANVYPKKKNITTYFCTGDCHEGWYAKGNGLNVGKAMQARFNEHDREDLQYVGHVEADIELRTPGLSKHATGPVIRVMHPGGGTAYAKSYKSQKWAASLQGGEKPQIALVGHYHKQGYFLERNIHVILAATTSDQSIFMRKLQITADVGYHIAEVKIGDDGAIVSLKLEFVHFFDKGYYQNYERF